MRRRAAVRLLGAGIVVVPSLAWARIDGDKPRRRIALDVGIERLGRVRLNDVRGMEAIEADLELARKGAPLKKRKGRRRIEPTEITMTRPATRDRFRELFEAWVESPDKRSIVISVRDAEAPTEVPRGLLKRWNLLDCWPKSWKVSAPKDDTSDTHVEELVIVTQWYEEA